MNGNSSLIEKEVVIVDKIMPTDFEAVEISFPLGYEVVNGSPVRQFGKRIKYIPTNYITIQVPKLVPKI